MSLIDRREDMTVSELIEELQLRFDDKVAYFEVKYRDELEALEFTDNEDELLEDEDLNFEDLRDELEEILKV